MRLHKMDDDEFARYKEECRELRESGEISEAAVNAWRERVYELERELEKELEGETRWLHDLSGEQVMRELRERHKRQKRERTREKIEKWLFAIVVLVVLYYFFSH